MNENVSEKSEEEVQKEVLPYKNILIVNGVLTPEEREFLENSTVGQIMEQI